MRWCYSFLTLLIADIVRHVRYVMQEIHGQLNNEVRGLTRHSRVIWEHVLNYLSQSRYNI